MPPRTTSNKTDGKVLPCLQLRLRPGNAHFEMTPEGIAFGLAHIRGVGTSAIEKINKVLGRETAVESDTSPAGASGDAAGQHEAGNATGCAGSLNSWPQFVRIATELPRNVAEGLVKAGAVDWTGMPRTQMLAELEAILGTSTGNEIGEKVEIKGLTERELEFFLAHFGECGSTQKTLGFMAQAGLDQAPRSLSQMSKTRVV